MRKIEDCVMEACSTLGYSEKCSLSYAVRRYMLATRGGTGRG